MTPEAALPEKSAVDKRHKRDFPIWGYLLLILACLWLRTGHWNTYRLLDGYGWIEHSHDTPIWIGGEWLTGEYRICKMPLMPGHSLPSSAHLLCGQRFEQETDSWPVDFIGSVPDHDFYELMGANWDAVEQHFHVLPVRYWGRINRTGQLMFSWRCQKQASGLVCDAIN
jgi:hypothetical protein